MARWFLLALLAVPVALVLTLPGTASAQLVLPGGDDDADADKKRDRKRDKKRDRKRDKKRGDDAPQCPEGKLVSADTRGQCCWPGQVWNGERCVGTPTACPDGLVASEDKQACVVPPCEAAMLLVDETHCCWPEQGWSIERDACVGRPSCPAGWVADGDEGCRRDPGALDADEDGIADADDACPGEPEDRNGYLDADGCPDTEALARLEALPPEEAEAGVSGTAIGGWLLLGTGLALGGGGAAMLFLAEGERDTVREAATTTLSDGRTVTTGVSQNEAWDLQERAELFETLGWVGVGVGSAALVTGVALLVLDAASPEAGDPSLSRLDLGWSADGPMITLRRRF